MDESEHVKEVYAHFGLAMFLAQCVEQSLIQLLFFYEFFPKNIKEKIHEDPGLWAKEYDKYDDLVSSKTMGSLLGAVRKLDVLTELQVEELKTALEKRNWLAHSYFSHRSLHFMSFEGRDQMIKELEECRDFLGNLDNRLMEIISNLSDKYGITEEALHEMKEEMLREVQSSF
ncbi:hypothetical protein KQ940_06105 [Marinobacterium sp. D7]|uniref:hypothetical protein n=1 Tax=Marinobacterium ramblicola TaxID=2849041 RepID=UPI001C2DC669|nr:hypothetical protein [Marinobacterium ramblicola]MBV1787624.1 hypothetical protein [Marinobacterium ramblicola]